MYYQKNYHMDLWNSHPAHAPTVMILFQPNHQAAKKDIHIILKYIHTENDTTTLKIRGMNTRVLHVL